MSKIDKMEMGKIAQIIIYIIFLSIPIGVFLFAALNVVFGPSFKQVMIETDLLKAVDGVVDTVYDDKPNHNIRTAVLKNNQIYHIEPRWESKIEAGDSILKKKGSFFLEVYKKDGKKVILDYRSTFSSSAPPGMPPGYKQN